VNPLFLVTAATSVLLLARQARGSLLPKGNVPKWQGTQAQILEEVGKGNYELRWMELPGYDGVEVSEDALRIEGIRVPVSARTLDSLCVMLEASPTTPLIDDLIYENATWRVAPRTFNVADPEAVWRFNAAIDEQLSAQSLGRLAWGLVSSVGKSWVLSNLALEHPGRAINYGLHSPSAPYKSVDGKVKVWQQPSWAHNPDHADYSQVARLCRLQKGASLPSHEKLKNNLLWIPR